MKTKSKVAVVGLGEVGKPLFDLASEQHDVLGVDIAPVGKPEQVDILHICYPFEIADFVGETTRYIQLFRPKLTIVNSTVAIGTTRRIAAKAGGAVVNSPIRGKHARMLEELRVYTKFIGALNTKDAEDASRHFQSMGLTTKTLSSPEATELAKLSETTYFGLLIAWAQEMERYCDGLGQSYDEVVSFYEGITFFPLAKYAPGVIGGHCVMPNIDILRKLGHSVILDAIQASNAMKIQREAHTAEHARQLTVGVL